MHAAPHQSADASATPAPALGDIDITGPMEPVLGALPGSRTAHATLWLSTRLAAAVRSYADGLADLGAPARISTGEATVDLVARLGRHQEHYAPPTALPRFAQVGGWSTQALGSASRRVHEAAAALESHLRELPGLLHLATPEQTETEVRSGELLLKALRHARWALHDGATGLDAALAELSEVTAAAVTAGLVLHEDGTAATPPGPVTVPEPRRPAEEPGHTARIEAALARVARTDAATAEALHAIEFPESLGSRVAAYLDRVGATRQVVASLGDAGAGALSIGKAAKSTGGLIGKGSAYLRFLRTTAVGLTRSQSVLRNAGTASRALRQFSTGAANGGVLRFLLGARIARGMGWVFLPLTIITGAIDVVTGGGTNGVRGWANRLFGALGAGGAGVLLVTELRWSAVGPGALGLAGAGVLAFSLWSLGTMLWDQRSRIGSFARAVADGARNRLWRGSGRG